MSKLSSGIKLSEEERKILRSKLSKYGSSKEIVKALEAVNPEVATISGNRLTQQTLNHYFTGRSISVEVAQTMYKLSGEDSELHFLIERRPERKYFPDQKIRLKLGDMEMARKYASNLLYDTAAEILRGVFIQLDEAKKETLINDLETLANKYQPK